jgi:hypothetical protein
MASAMDLSASDVFRFFISSDVCRISDRRDMHRQKRGVGFNSNVEHIYLPGACKRLVFSQL